MTKLEFIAKLKEKLDNLPQKEVLDRIDFYSEMIISTSKKIKTEKICLLTVQSSKL